MKDHANTPRVLLAGRAPPEQWQQGLKEQQAIKELKLALGNLQAGFKHAGVHNDILKLTFVSKMHQQEFLTNKDEILKKMRQIYKDKNLKDKISFTSVIALYSSKPALKQTSKSKKLELPFDERSTGNFKNVCSGKIGSLFEQIKNNIKEHNNHDPKAD